MVTRDRKIDRWRTAARFGALAILLALLAGAAVAVALGRTAMEPVRTIWCEPNTLCPTPSAPPSIPWRRP